MKTATIAFLQAIRLRMLLDTQQGRRKDSRVRICRDLKRRLGIADAEFARYVRDMGNGSLMLNLPLINAQPGCALELRSEEETRVLTELLDGIEWSVSDLDGWVEPLMEAITREAATMPSSPSASPSSSS